ncbi:MAG: hypothetical protein ACOYJD_06650 [Christensenellales bacterium]|jgi:F0F1-type ATP synthase membrane subunit b/b'
MKLYELLGDLIKELESSKGVFLTSKKAVDVDYVLRILEEIKLEIPVEVKKARIMMDEQERIMTETKAEARAILEDANSRAYDIIAEAESKAELLSSDNEITRKAYEKSQAIIEQANANAEDIIEGSRVYADDILARMERQLEQQLHTLRQNRAELK